MNRLIDSIQKVRHFLLKQIEPLDVANLNEIPTGFNNNIAWNLGHLIAAQQGICYVRTGAKMVVEDKYYLEYKPGTKPERYIEQGELEHIKTLLITSLEQLPQDYSNGNFSSYPSWTTRYGVEISSIEDAIQFVLFHEGLHSGVIQAMKRMIEKKF